MGLVYRGGIGGMPENLDLAKKWFLKAGKQFHRDSQQAYNEVAIELELQSGGSNLVRPLDVVQQGHLYLAAAKKGEAPEHLEDMKAPPFYFGLPYEPEELSRGLGTVRNPDMLWLYGLDGDKEFFKFKAQVISELVTDELPKLLKQIKKVGPNKREQLGFEKFVLLLKKLGAKRGELAKKLGSVSAQDFGVWRTHDLHTPISPEDPVRGRFQPWGRYAKETVGKLAKELLTDTQATSVVAVTDGATNQFRSRVSLSLFHKRMYDLLNKYHAHELRSFCLERYPNIYEDSFPASTFCAADGVRYLLLTIEVGIKETFLPVTRISGIFRPDQEKSNGFSQKSLASFFTSPLIAEHVSETCIDPLLQVCSSLWVHVLSGEGKLSSLNRELAILHYCLDCASPFKRGSGWVTEVLVEALFNYRGYDVFLKPGTISMVQLVFGTTYEDFVTSFPKMVHIVPRTLHDDAMTG